MEGHSRARSEGNASSISVILFSKFDNQHEDVCLTYHHHNSALEFDYGACARVLRWRDSMGSSCVRRQRGSVGIFGRLPGGFALQGTGLDRHFHPTKQTNKQASKHASKHPPFFQFFVLFPERTAKGSSAGLSRAGLQRTRTRIENLHRELVQRTYSEKLAQTSLNETCSEDLLRDLSVRDLFERTCAQDLLRETYWERLLRESQLSCLGPAYMRRRRERATKRCLPELVLSLGHPFLDESSWMRFDEKGTGSP